MTATDTALTADQIAFAAKLEARRIARATAPTPQQKAAATRAKKAAAQLALAMGQYERDVAANPSGIIYNPTTKDFDLYRAGVWCGSYGTQLQAERAQLELVARDLAHAHADSPADVGELNDEEIMAMAEMHDTAAVVTDEAPAVEMSEEARLVTAWYAALNAHGWNSVGSEEAYAVLCDWRRDQGLALCVNGDCAYSGRALECPRCAVTHPTGLLSVEEMDAHSGALPLSLPVCEMPGCGRTCAQHGERWCGCIPEVAPVLIADALDADLMAPTSLHCGNCEGIQPESCPICAPVTGWCGWNNHGEEGWHRFDQALAMCGEPRALFTDSETFARPGDGLWCVACVHTAGGYTPFGPDDPLPFTSDPLEALETLAGVIDADPPPSELGKRIAGCELLLVQWGDALVDGRDVETARMALIRALLDTEQWRRLDLAMDWAA